MAAPDLTPNDAFDRFNRLQGANAAPDPYPEWAKKRRETPVWLVPPTEFFESGMLMPGSPDQIAVPLSFDAVVEVLRDGETFSSSAYANTMGLVMGHSILEMDEPEHFKYRGLIQSAFNRRQLDRWENELVRPLIEGCVAEIRSKGRGDLVRDLTFPFPVRVICGMIGLPEETHATFHRLALELIMIAFDPALGMAASAGLRELFSGVLAERRRAPRDDLMSELAMAELDGTRLDDEQIYAFLRLLAPAGAETTYRSSSNLLLGLLSDPEQWEAVRSDPGLIPAAIEEGLRWECPLTGIQRTAARDAEICGVKIPAGTPVHVCLGAANRDETRWENPDRFDIHRPRLHHSSFAFGPHTCLGMHLARMETRILLETLFEQLPGLRLDPDAEAPHITGRMFRSPLALPVVFDA
ncbi:MAG: cytochrome P450 [Deltaproteobacteria bacterium]|nr:cytochrome P450 [Deltaproteobacteria bacterium]MBW2392926.1 cytochrome P450 [Deltaproteobacteria bacterium]